MRRNLALLTTVVALVLSVAVPAMGSPADPSICIDADVNINDEIVLDESICLPPDGGQVARSSSAADPSVCAEIDLNINDEIVADESIWLPPEGGELPDLELPEPPVRLLRR